ncbi:ABC transporter ATP-binding protein [Niallia sp. BSM11]|uniref:ABC transporter ATP-binding protein n=1 Tax=Niallia sp. BSM11 TaxID=3391576 RepID=UPI0039846E3B
MIKLENISKNYKDFTALTSIDMQFDKGIYGLLAPNGAGKTTLIKMLVTLITPTTGTIYFNNQPISTLGEKYRELIGYLPQHFGYYKHNSPVQYLRYLAALKGMDKRTVEMRIDEVLNVVALTDVKNKKMRKFSGGMIQRVGIAQALLSDPHILILDEPTAGLDPKERARFRHLLSEIAREKIILVSTHVVSDIESIANKIVMIKNKKLLYKEDPTTICQSLAGKIYETTIPFQDFKEFRKRYLTLSEKQEDGQILVRFYTEQAPFSDWRAVSPQLEDVFLVVYADEQRG